MYRRKLKLTLLDTIPRLIDFLRDTPDDELRVGTTEGVDSFMDLVRAATERGEVREWAEGQIVAQGVEARASLIALLADPQERQNHPAIARLLLELFPSAESLRAVEELVGPEPDPKRKSEYVALLACAQADAEGRGRTPRCT